MKKDKFNIFIFAKNKNYTIPTSRKKEQLYVLIYILIIQNNYATKCKKYLFLLQKVDLIIVFKSMVHANELQQFILILNLQLLRNVMDSLLYYELL